MRRTRVFAVTGNRETTMIEMGAEDRLCINLIRSKTISITSTDDCSMALVSRVQRVK